MTIATAVCAAAFLGAGVCTEAQNKVVPVIACNLRAIQESDPPRYNMLMRQLRVAVRKRDSRANGYAYKLDSTVMTLHELTQWINLERLCCPFFEIQLSAAGNQQGWVLTLTGPVGVKALLQAEFPKGLSGSSGS